MKSPDGRSGLSFLERLAYGGKDTPLELLVMTADPYKCLSTSHLVRPDNNGFLQRFWLHASTRRWRMWGIANKSTKRPTGCSAAASARTGL